MNHTGTQRESLIVNGNVASECPTPDALRAYLDQRLSSEDSQLIEQHVETCGECESSIQSLLKLESTLFLLSPQTASAQDESIPPENLQHYECLELLDTGGFGMVWKMRDLRFERLVAVKVMQARHAKQPSLVRRFLAEAQICSQLSHPFIVPVHDMGALPDGRGFYVMKLVEGQRLDQHFAPPIANSDGFMPRIQAFGNICQALAHAHEKQVIHRDLKPQNVMVGRHGEIQVMDWGLAKSLSQKGDVQANDEIVSETSRHPVDQTAADGALGTYSYMPPEQFANPAAASYPADVFSLGAILFELLTGSPPFSRTSGDLASRAALRSTELIECHQRIQQTVADRELIDLALACLAADPQHRPPNAAAVAERLDRYLASVDQRLEQEKLLRERQQVRVEEQTKRNRLRLWLAGTAVVLAGLLGVGGVFWQQQDALRSREQALAEIDLDEATDAFDRADFQTTERLLSRAEARLNTFDSEHVRARLERLQLASTLVTRLRQIQDERTTPQRDGLFDNVTAVAHYVQAFQNFGVEMSSEDVASIHQKLVAGDVAEAVLSPLDNWATVCMYDMLFDPDNQDQHRRQRDRLLKLGHMICKDETENQLRIPSNWDDLERLQELAEKAIARSDLSPELSSLLAELLRVKEGNPEPLLRHYQAKYRGDFWLNFNLARWLLMNEPAKSFAFHHAALALRPDNVVLITNLGQAYLETGDDITARQYFDLAISLYPKFFPAAALRLATFRKENPEDALKKLNDMESELINSGENLNLWVFPDVQAVLKTSISAE